MKIKMKYNSARNISNLVNLGARKFAEESVTLIHTRSSKFKIILSQIKTHSNQNWVGENDFIYLEYIMKQ